MRRTTTLKRRLHRLRVASRARATTPLASSPQPARKRNPTSMTLKRRKRFALGSERDDRSLASLQHSREAVDALRLDDLATPASEHSDSGWTISPAGVHDAVSEGTVTAVTAAIMRRLVLRSSRANLIHSVTLTSLALPCSTTHLRQTRVSSVIMRALGCRFNIYVNAIADEEDNRDSTSTPSNNQFDVLSLVPAETVSNGIG